ncbi:MAG: DUF975 family protein [Ruminococcaceae bacterium]|nr:DUF975 family protein [Oscillospiraceae bacterium]
MKYASDFRKIARDALFGNWKVAVLTGFVASIIGGTTSGGSVNFSSNDNSSTNTLNELPLGEALELIVPIILSLGALLAIWALALLIIGGAAKLGYARFNLNLIDRKPAAFSDLFSCFNRLGDGICMDLLMALYIFLWTLLFIIPGIIKAYSYAMTPYILSEHPEMTVNQAITESRRIMNGNKWRLFCLRFSFIGWMFLCVLPMFVLLPLVMIGVAGFVLWVIVSFGALIGGLLFLTPYQEAAQAAFYREISYVPQYEAGTENEQL